MDFLSTGIPIICVLLGALISGSSAVLRGRNERKRLIAEALSDLLEVRHKMVAVDLALTEVHEKLKVPVEGFQAIRALVDSVGPIESELHQRYGNAVNLLASVDPVLAFYLRSKTGILSVITSLRAAMIDGGSAAAEVEKAMQILSSLFVPELNSAVLTLGFKHSVFTWWKVRQLIKVTEHGLPLKAKELISKAQTLITPFDNPI